MADGNFDFLVEGFYGCMGRVLGLVYIVRLLGGGFVMFYFEDDFCE
jgi:hypothetical protein